MKNKRRRKKKKRERRIKKTLQSGLSRVGCIWHISDFNP
jgi:hypothetical protein